MSNIDKILDGFNSNPKKITYEDYLKWSGGDQNMFSYIAFYKLMKMPKVKAKDLVNVYENFSPEYIRENLELNSNEDDGAAAIRFCNEYPGKPECICVNNTLIQIAKLDRDKIEFRNSYNIVDLNNKVKNWIYQYKVKEYDEVIDPAQRLKYKNEEHFVEERAKVRGPPDAGNKWDPGRWRDDWGAFNTNNWRGYYSDEYINRELMPIFKINNYPNEELYKSDELPKPGAFELKSNCCSNVLEAHANVTMENIKLSCNQKIMSLSAMKEAEERAAAEEAEEAEEKRKEEEEKREAAEEADAKKKKMFKYIVIGIVSLVFIGIVGFAAYKIFTSNSGTSDLGTSDLGTSDSGASDSGASDSGTSDSGASNLIVIGIVSLVFIGIIGFAAYKIFTSNSGSPDLGTSDSGSSDLSASDSGSSDLSASDSGSPDLGTSDSGTSEEEEEAAILAAEEADEKKKRMFKYIVIGIVSLVFIGIFGFAAYKIFTSNSGDDESGASESGASEAGSPDLGDSEAETPSVRDAYE